MHIRDAVEADAEAMVNIADAPADVMRNLIHDRTVRVAEAETETVPTDPHEDTETQPRELLGVVSFDARSGTVHITQLDGTEAACEQLLAEPVRFAEREEMDVEYLIPQTRPSLIEVAERVGFERAGTGPQFDGTTTLRYRMTP